MRRSSRNIVPSLRTLFSPVVSSFVTAVRGIAFWTATVLPLLYLPLLFLGFAGGEMWLLGSLVVLNVAVLVVGHDYEGTLGKGFDESG